MSYLLDTNIISEVRKPSAHPNVRAWFGSVGSESLYLSVIVVGEVRQGIERLRHRDPAQATIFDAWLEQLRRDYRDRVIPITAEIAEEWGRLNVQRSIPTADGLLAATAITLGLTFVTRNTADVVNTGVRILNPFDAS